MQVEAEYFDPQRTLELMDLLEQVGLNLQRFRLLHHCNNTATLGGHRTYARKIKRGVTGQFDTVRTGNAATAKRMAVCLQLLRDGRPWDEAIAETLRRVPIDGRVVFMPTADEDELSDAVTELLARPTPATPPVGQVSPQRIGGESWRFVRDPNVVAWTLQRASGRCEQCEGPAPFLRSDGTPYLEVHHVVRLADGGSDRTSNTVAVCPNCHRMLHHSPDASAAVTRLYARISELRAESPTLQQ